MKRLRITRPIGLALSGLLTLALAGLLATSRELIVLGCLLVISLPVPALLGMARPTRKNALTWLLAYTLTLVAISLAGLELGELLYPDSNLLGGFGLIFGPPCWIGAGLLMMLSADRRRVVRTHRMEVASAPLVTQRATLCPNPR